MEPQRQRPLAFPELAGLASAHADVLLDGEVVVLRSGVPSFPALAERFHVRDVRRGGGSVASAPATLIAFDVLRLYGVDLTARPWQERREALERLGPSGTVWQLSPGLRRRARPARRHSGARAGGDRRQATRVAVPGGGAVGGLGQARAPARGVLRRGRWRYETDDPGRVGALLLGLWSQGPGRRVLRYAGKAGSGLATADQSGLRQAAGRGRGGRSPFDPPVPRPDCVGAHWLEPHSWSRSGISVTPRAAG